MLLACRSTAEAPLGSAAQILQSLIQTMQPAKHCFPCRGAHTCSLISVTSHLTWWRATSRSDLQLSRVVFKLLADGIMSSLKLCITTCLQAFKGIWRMQQGLHGTGCTTLLYSVFVRPQVSQLLQSAGACTARGCLAVMLVLMVTSSCMQIWLPVRLIQSRIEGEIRANLSAVRQHSELVQRQQTKAPTW